MVWPGFLSNYLYPDNFEGETKKLILSNGWVMFRYWRRISRKSYYLIMLIMHESLLKKIILP